MKYLQRYYTRTLGSEAPKMTARQNTVTPASMPPSGKYQTPALMEQQEVNQADALFNTFNSQKLKSSQRHGNSFRGSSSRHAFLEDSLKFT